MGRQNRLRSVHELRDALRPRQHPAISVENNYSDMFTPTVVRLLWELCFDTGGDAIPGAEYMHFGGFEFITPIDLNDLELNGVVNSWAKRGLPQSLFIESNFSRWSSGDAGGDMYVARKMTRHMERELIGMHTCPTRQHQENRRQKCGR